jgi:hypothetical protein
MTREGRYHRTCCGLRRRFQVNAIPEESNNLDFWDLTKVVFRRWKISLPLLLLSILATGAIAATAKPDYIEDSYIQLVPLSTGVQNNANSALSNPYSALGLNTMGQAVIYAVQDQAFLDALKAEGHTTNFTLTMTYPNPIVTVEVVGTTAADTVATTQLVVKKFEDSSRALQKAYGVKDQDLITTQRLDQSDNVKPSGGKVKRAIIAVAAAGFLMTCGVTVGVDAVSRRRARRKRDAEDKINPLAIELALARADAVPAPTNGEGHDLRPKIPVVRIEPVIPAARAEPVLPRIEPFVAPLPAEPPTTPITLPTVPPAGATPTAGSTGTTNGTSGATPGTTPSATPTSPAAPAEATQAIEAAVNHHTRPSTSKPPRVLKAGTYRSINANSDQEADPARVPGDSVTPTKAVPPDVTIVIPPEWAAGENGKRH